MQSISVHVFSRVVLSTSKPLLRLFRRHAYYTFHSFNSSMSLAPPSASNAVLVGRPSQLGFLYFSPSIAKLRTCGFNLTPLFSMSIVISTLAYFYRLCCNTVASLCCFLSITFSRLGFYYLYRCLFRLLAHGIRYISGKCSLDSPVSDKIKAFHEACSIHQALMI
jgi:hypothetical protein